MARPGSAARAPVRVAIAAAGLAILAASASGCGRKGPPLVPLVRIPAPVDDLTLRRMGDEVYLTFTVPARNVDGSTPPDVTRVELVALDTDTPPAPQDFGPTAAAIATIQVSLSAPDAAGEPPPVPRTAAPGERVTVRDTLDSAVAEGVRRFYLARAYGPRDRTSPGGRATGTPAGPAPAPPQGLAVTFSAETVTLTWAESDGVSGYHVYEATAESGAPSSEPPMPLTRSPLERPVFVEPVRFGVERCWEVRSVSAGDSPIEGGASPPTCLTPLDIFPPSAPTALSAVAGPDGIALRWTPSPEPDVAGYVVLRGTTADDTLLPITDAPVVEPRLLDRDVVSGVRYVYAVVAVDTRQPAPNRSPESTRDAVTAR